MKKKLKSKKPTQAKVVRLQADPPVFGLEVVSAEGITQTTHGLRNLAQIKEKAKELKIPMSSISLLRGTRVPSGASTASSPLLSVPAEEKAKPVAEVDPGAAVEEGAAGADPLDVSTWEGPQKPRKKTKK